MHRVSQSRGWDFCVNTTLEGRPARPMHAPNTSHTMAPRHPASCSVGSQPFDLWRAWPFVGYCRFRLQKPTRPPFFALFVTLVHCS